MLLSTMVGLSELEHHFQVHTILTNGALGHNFNVQPRATAGARAHTIAAAAAAAAGAAAGAGAGARAHAGRARAQGGEIQMRSNQNHHNVHRSYPESYAAWRKEHLTEPQANVELVKAVDLTLKQNAKTLLDNFWSRLKDGGTGADAGPKADNPHKLSQWDLLLALELADPTSERYVKLNRATCDETDCNF